MTKKFWSLKNFPIAIEADDVYSATQILRQALEELTIELEETGDVKESFRYPPLVYSSKSRDIIEKSGSDPKDYVGSVGVFSTKKSDDKPN